MTRLAVAIVLALFLGQATVSFASAARDACRVGCPDDGPDGSCSPACEDACCANPLRTLMVNPDPVAAPARSPRIVCVQQRGSAASGVVSDVFHVPRVPLA